jgi:hypothetical protein
LANVRGEVIVNFIFVMAIAITLSINSGRYCASYDWDVKKWLTEMAVVYGVDMFLCSW